jgi:hypothetical protein
MGDWRGTAERGWTFLHGEASDEESRTRCLIEHIKNEGNRDDYISKDFFNVLQTSSGRQRMIVRMQAVALAAMVLVLLNTRPAAADEWTCSIDLHQGHTGTLGISRTDGVIKGTLTAGRSGPHEIRGVWSETTIKFRRQLSPTSVQLFVGAASTIDTGEVKMGGRFAAALAGVWSADCRREGIGDPASPPPPPTPPHPAGDIPGPALNIRTDPFQPTATDRVRFIAKASHSAGVQDITIHVNGAPAKTCPSDSCEFIGGPFAAGMVRWRVSARSRNGGENKGFESELEVRPVATGTCSIAGRATGPRANLANMFFVILLGPDDDHTTRGSVRFEAGHYLFTSLPDGNYLLRTDSKVDFEFSPSPSSRRVRCSGGALTGQDFEFR